MHDKCAEIKRASSTVAKGFVCQRCVQTTKEIVETDKESSFYGGCSECSKEFSLLEEQVECQWWK